MPESEFVSANSDLEVRWTRYRVAQMAKSRWGKEEEEAKAELLQALGYEPSDPKPQPLTVVGMSGEPLFEVKVGERRGLDTKYLRAKHPEIYAESEAVTHPISIREAK